MKPMHWLIVAIVAVAMVLLPVWFNLRGTGVSTPMMAPMAAGDDSSGNLRDNGTRGFIGGGRRSGK